MIKLISECSSGFPYFLQFKSEFCNKKFRIWATLSSRSCFCWLYSASPSLAAKNIINLISVLTTGQCPYVESSLAIVGRGSLLWPVHSLGKTLLAFALIHFVCQAKFACYFLTIIQMKWQIHSRDYIWYIECLKNYEWKFATLYRRQWSRPSPRKINKKGKMVVWGRLTNNKKEEKIKAKQKRKDILI